MGAPILSKELSIYFNCDASITVDSSMLGFATDFDLEINKEIIDITTLDDPAWMQKMVDLKSWNSSFSGLVTRTDASLSKYDIDRIEKHLIENDTSINMAMRLDVSSNQFVYGAGLLTNVKKSGSKGAEMTFSGSIEGAGVLDVSTLV